MAENQIHDQSSPIDGQVPSPHKEDMIACVMELEAALLPCLPARELQAIDRSPHPSHQMTLGECQRYYLTYGKRLKGSTVLHPLVDVERHAREFMEAAKKLQLYFIGLQQDENPSKAELLRKEISKMEEELKTKTELIKKHEKFIQGWRKELKEQLDKHVTELERV